MDLTALYVYQKKREARACLSLYTQAKLIWVGGHLDVSENLESGLFYIWLEQVT